MMNSKGIKTYTDHLMNRFVKALENKINQKKD